MSIEIGQLLANSGPHAALKELASYVLKDGVAVESVSAHHYPSTRKVSFSITLEYLPAETGEEA